MLRKKLAAYYAGAGLADQVIVSLPKGHYVPEFERRLPELLTIARPHPRRGFLLWLGVGGAILLLLLLMWGVGLNRSRRAGSSTDKPDWNNHPLWAGFFEPNSSTKLILGAAMFYYVPGSGLIVRDNHVQMPDSPDTKARLAKLETLFGTKLMPAEIYTGLGDAVAAYSIGNFFNHAARNLPIELSRHSRWEDLVTGNVIIVASLRFRTLRQELQFPSEFLVADDTARISLIHPREGERKDYGSEFTGGESGTDYALISVWPGTVPGRHVMTIGGLFTWGTAGAAHFATNPEDLLELKKKLESDSGRPTKSQGLQILIRVQVRDGQPIGEQYITHRWLPS